MNSQGKGKKKMSVIQVYLFSRLERAGHSYTWSQVGYMSCASRKSDGRKLWGVLAVLSRGNSKLIVLQGVVADSTIFLAWSALIPYIIKWKCYFWHIVIEHWSCYNACGRTCEQVTEARMQCCSSAYTDSPVLCNILARHFTTVFWVTSVFFLKTALYLLYSY